MLNEPAPEESQTEQYILVLSAYFDYGRDLTQTLETLKEIYKDYTGCEYQEEDGEFYTQSTWQRMSYFWTTYYDDHQKESIKKAIKNITAIKDADLPEMCPQKLALAEIVHLFAASRSHNWAEEGSLKSASLNNRLACDLLSMAGWIDNTTSQYLATNGEVFLAELKIKLGSEYMEHDASRLTTSRAGPTNTIWG